MRTDLREVNEIAQTALDKVRSLSQALHPSILDELGLESAIESYVAIVERQLGLRVVYERSGPPLAIDPATSIQVYRVLQEALTLTVEDGETVGVRPCQTTATVNLRGITASVLTMQPRAPTIAPMRWPAYVSAAPASRLFHSQRSSAAPLRPLQSCTLAPAGVPVT